MLSDNISFIKKEIKKACLDICRDPNEITHAVNRALHSGKPSLLDIVIDGEIQ